MAASIGTNNPVGRLYVDHGSVGSTTWPVRIQNPNTSFVASLRVTNDGFFDVTSHAPCGSSFAQPGAISKGLLCNQVYSWEKTILSESGVRRAESAKNRFPLPTLRSSNATPRKDE